MTTPAELLAAWGNLTEDARAIVVGLHASPNNSWVVGGTPTLAGIRSPGELREAVLDELYYCPLVHHTSAKAGHYTVVSYFAHPVNKLPSPAPEVRIVELWYNGHERSWVVQVKDAEGNQLGDADYSGTKVGAVQIQDLRVRDLRNAGHPTTAIKGKRTGAA